MNIFILDKDPVKAATMQCDKHIPKMVTESAQMLSTAHRMLDGTMEYRPSKSGKRMIKYWALPDDRENILYKAVHMGHPCTVWTMKTEANYMWHYVHFAALAKEYTYRFEKSHASYVNLGYLLQTPPNNIPVGSRTPFALAMKNYPECIVEGDPVQSYRNFYHADKADFAYWRHGRRAPDWWSL